MTDIAVNTRLPEELWHRIKALALEKRERVQDVVRRALEREVARKR